MMNERITTFRGDVGLGRSACPPRISTCWRRVTSSSTRAATVSFDSPLDTAVEINLLGPSRIATVLGELDVAPHLVSVSTRYVAGNRRGNAPEELVSAGPFDLGLSWRN